MHIFQYPLCPGSWRANSKYRFSEYPASWVGPRLPVRPNLSLDDAVAFGQQRLNVPGSKLHVRFNLGAGGVRGAVTGTKAFVTGGYPSRKTGYPNEHESMNEYALFKSMEVDPGVVDYRAQPMVFFDPEEKGQKGAYYADTVRWLSDGILQILEVKGDRTDIGDGEYAAKLASVSEACCRIGWQFLVIEGRPLREKNVFNFNVEEIQARRFTATPQALQVRVARTMQKAGGRIALGELVEVLGGLPLGLDIICSLICQRKAYADLRYPLTGDTVIYSVQGEAL